MLYDKNIREPLFEFLDEEYGKCRIIEEKTMGHSRADVVLITEDALTGIEIKSDADTYARLERQVRDYDKYFDRNIVVIGSSHALHIREHVPDYWGIITVDEIDQQPDFYFYRKPQSTPARKIRLKYQLRMLWREELAHLQELNQLPRYKDKSKKFVQDKLVEKIPPEVLLPQIREELFERDYNGIDARIRAYRSAVKSGKKES